IEDLGDARRRGDIGRPLPRKQTEYKIRTVGRKLEQRLVKKLNVEIAVPDIDDECHRWFERRDVREVLLGAHAHVNAALLGNVEELRNDVLKRRLVGQQVVRAEGPVFL